MRLLELFCGIGGGAVACGPAVELAAAVDIDREALAVHALNVCGPVFCRTIESLGAGQFAAWQAELWWLSPPCQPFTRRGRGRDLNDPRSQALIGVCQRIAELRPPHVALENVPEFAGSQARALLCRTLDAAGYEVVERVLCPSELGMPARRRRYYLVASRRGLRELAWETRLPRALAEFLLPDPPADLWVDEEFARRYAEAMHVVDPEDDQAVAACFTSAYGRSPVQSGSYLKAGGRLRRFAPVEILRLLGFPPEFRLPPEMSRRRAWSLVGNSLSIPVVRRVLGQLPFDMAVGGGGLVPR